MFEKLKKLCKEGTFGSFYTSPERPSQFKYGCILAVNDDELLMLEISPEGNFDGLSLLDTSLVYRVEVDAQYHKRMELLTKPFKKPVVEISDERIKHSFLRYIASEKRIAIFSVGESEDAFNGFVTEISDNICTIKQVDYYGKDDGISYLEIGEITSIAFDSAEAQELNVLWNGQKLLSAK